MLYRVNEIPEYSNCCERTVSIPPKPPGSKAAQRRAPLLALGRRLSCDGARGKPQNMSAEPVVYTKVPGRRYT